MGRSLWPAARIAKLWLDVTLVVGLIAGLFLTSALLLAPLVWSDDTDSDLSVWVAVGERPIRPVVPLEVHAVGGTTPSFRDARLVNGQGELRALTSSLPLHLAFLGSYLVMLAMALWVVWLIRRVIVAALDGRPFDRANVRCLRLAGLLVMLAAVAWPLLQYLLGAEVLRHLASVHPPISPALSFGTDAILIGLVLLILSTVFSHGADLEDERAMTV